MAKHNSGPRIAILGWGSLIWDPRDLAYRGRWYKTGPLLPIEFSRISTDGRLTLVVDPVNGVAVKTRYSFSSGDTLEQAISNLNVREGRPGSEKIGVVRLYPVGPTSPLALKHHAGACEVIRQWGIDKKMDAVIWTALEPNFEARLKEQRPTLPSERTEFTRHNAAELLLNHQKAIEYLEKAPREVVTPVRTFWEAKLREHLAAQRR